MRRYLICFGLGFGACGAPKVQYQSNYQRTWEICSFTEEYRLSTPAAMATLPSQACVDAIHADFGTNLSRFLDHDHLGDPYSIVTGDPTLVATTYGLLLLNARALLLAELPPLREIEASQLISPDFLEEMHRVSEATGESDLGPILYNFASSIIENTNPADKESSRASFDAESRTLVISTGTRDPIVLGTLLVHESRHLWGPHHSCSWDAHQSCDTDPTGAYGFGLSAKILLRRSTEDPALHEAIDPTLKPLLHRIESLCDADGQLNPHWAATQAEDL